MRARAERSDEPLRVLFVCTANVSRSPYAERRTAHLLPSGPDAAVRATSAGVPGFPGRGMDPEMMSLLRERGGDHLGHVSRSVSSTVLEQVDVVITVEFAHRLRISEQWPHFAPKVFGLNQLADALGRVEAPSGGLATLDAALQVARPDSLTWDVADPYRRGRSAARVCADEIDAALTMIVPALIGVPVGSGTV